MLRFIPFLLVILASITTGCVVRNYTVAGNSMMPVLANGDIILIDYRRNSLDRGDIVIFNDPKKNEVAICRIIGLPNEEIKVEDNKVYINNQLFNESYVSPENSIKNKNPGVSKISSNEYFVMGDDRDHSKDSRDYGSIASDKILGKYKATLYHSK